MFNYSSISFLIILTPNLHY